LTWFLVFVGGGTGATVRALLAAYVASPWGTLVCNVLGSFLLAVLLHPTVAASTEARAALGTGLLGGFTTYSTFNLEVARAAQEGHPWRAAGLALGTVALCLAASAAGWAVAARWKGAGAA
jgi:CrcB protein